MTSPLSSPLKARLALGGDNEEKYNVFWWAESAIEKRVTPDQVQGWLFEDAALPEGFVEVEPLQKDGDDRRRVS